MTSLVRYQPYLPFQEIFDSFLVPRSETLGEYPTMDVMESEDEYLLTANMPGIAAEDISVEVEDGVVAISASVSSENESGNNGYVVRERKMGGGPTATANVVRARWRKGECGFSEGGVDCEAPKGL